MTVDCQHVLDSDLTTAAGAVGFFTIPDVAELRFDGRVAIVTGAGRGVGRCHVLLLAARGDAAEIVEAAIDAYGRLDILVNNAGIADPGFFEDLTLEQFRRMNAVHYLGVVYVTKAAYPHLQAAGYGRIVNTFSEGVLGMVPKNTSYAGGKGGPFGFTRALALDAVRQGIRVNAVAPRAGTRLSAPEVMAALYDEPAELFMTLPDRFPPEQVSPAMAYLAHESCTLNGEIIIAGRGEAKRLALLESRGIQSDDMTPEFIAEHLDQLLDLADADLVTIHVVRGEA